MLFGSIESLYRFPRGGFSGGVGALRDLETGAVFSFAFDNSSTWNVGDVVGYDKYEGAADIGAKNLQLAIGLPVANGGLAGKYYGRAAAVAEYVLQSSLSDFQLDLLKTWWAANTP
jgi:hypothetical protein